MGPRTKNTISWIAITITVLGILSSAIWVQSTTYFQSQQNAKDIERLRSQQKVYNDLILGGYLQDPQALD